VVAAQGAGSSGQQGLHGGKDGLGHRAGVEVVRSAALILATGAWVRTGRRLQLLRGGQRFVVQLNKVKGELASHRGSGGQADGGTELVQQHHLEKFIHSIAYIFGTGWRRLRTHHT
jgi:hypothetical protein